MKEVNNIFLSSIVSNPILRSYDVKRYSGVALSRDEDIQQHTFQVSIISYILGLKLIELGNDLDIGILLEKALLHDIDESLTGDIPRPIKYYSKEVKDGISDLASNSLERLCSHLKLSESSERIKYMVQSCKEGSTGVLVECADLLTVALKSHEEVIMLGNKKFLKVANESSLYINNLCSKLLTVITKEENSYINKEGLKYLHEVMSDSSRVMESMVKDNLNLISYMNLDNYNFCK